jgi:hypothetical protein
MERVYKTFVKVLFVNFVALGINLFHLEALTNCLNESKRNRPESWAHSDSLDETKGNRVLIGSLKVYSLKLNLFEKTTILAKTAFV